ncbi:hypothetical protein HPA12_11470, partial [Streptococcus suis]|nr:hypothetical protein [Streptococcus suis]
VSPVVGSFNGLPDSSTHSVVIFKKVVTPVKEVTTEWVDESGNPLKDPTTGETPSEAGTIDGYEFVGTTTDENGNVKHIFKKVVTPVKE